MALFLPAAELQLARGESFRDTALVLSRFLSALMIRTYDQAEVEEFAEHASIPVINGLTDRAHPLQALADAMTLRERFGIARRPSPRLRRRRQQRLQLTHAHRRPIRDALRRGDARRATSPTPDVVAAATEDAIATGGSVQLVTEARDAVRGAQAVYTDVWTSMGQDADRERRIRDLEPFRIDDSLLDLADREAVATALPAGARRRGDHRGRALRPALPRLGAGREPAPHAEGADGARHSVTFDDHVRAALDELPPEPRRRRSRTSPSSSRTRIPRIPICSASTTVYRCRSAATWPACSRTRSRSTAFRSRSRSPIPPSSRRRSASRCSTSSAHYFGLDEDQLAELGYD